MYRYMYSRRMHVEDAAYDSLADARSLVRDQERLLQQLRALRDSIARLDWDVSKEFDSLLMGGTAGRYLHMT